MGVKHSKKRSRTTKDGRTILSAADYRIFRRCGYDWQNRACFVCGRPLPFDEFDVHHHGGRGMGGSKRGDRWFFHNDIAVEAAKRGEMIKGMCYGVCRTCHREFSDKLVSAKLEQ